MVEILSPEEEQKEDLGFPLNKKCLKLKGRKNFKKVLHLGEKKVTSNFIMLAMLTKNNFVRVGFIVSKKVSKKAVLRNKAKRRLKAAVSQITKLKKLNKNFDYIFIARKRVLSSSFNLIVKDLNETIT